MPTPAMFTRPPSPPIIKIPGHFGDIMSRRDTTLTLPEGFTGQERIMLTANGNLQRLISAYFNKTVSITILENTRVPLLPDEDPAVIARFQREVNLLCNEKVVCNAKSQVLIKDQAVYDLVVEKGVGIGQIFRYLDKLPSFELHGLGRTDKTFWREYSLEIPGVYCRLLEVLPSSLFDHNWLEKEPEDISWDIDIGQGQMTWINPDLQDCRVSKV
ncbi:hypothetical protein BX616_003830 [Lobosporangium transversale]|uniref:Uncharacterized protein n=1 Tax=Lobosporangium transversale TaxID=64571 RepID=A0A1Y2GRR7_9FUNG|nr:hypothetical protein BCR41DRAFT_350386 [Lobosporangium transversale]KAF9898599.1 hypothetical protein BX616_003830 [Lobosporangium transversale]ORZ20840.1 hypothetical protein BCR41DRAFT_350386 [Lobosporangium transversale]|eukprot:XP_021882749.1 hypothetical protein BCR41DRAFT_350386 [Lobosporangium transversale]